MKEIIILGGGFAGVSAAVGLQKKLKNEANITLIDKNPYHLFTPSLYEVATSEENKKNIAIPLSEILNKSVKIIKGVVETIDKDNRLVSLKDKTNYSYDFLIIALGSESSYFGIEGLRENSLALKNLEEAVSIRKKIEETYHNKVKNGKKMEIVVGGGGFSGTELTAELIEYRQRLSNHHKLPLDKVNITVIQGSERLLKELSQKDSVLAQKRLEKNKVNIILNAHIKKVDEKNVETDTNAKYPYDVLIWTGGVRASNILEKSGFKVNGRGQVAVDDKLQVLNSSNIFAVGDISEFADPLTNKPVPGVAEVAEDEGLVAAANVNAIIASKELTSYNFKHTGYIIPLSGKYAIADLSFIKVSGFLGWILQQMVFLYYLLKIMSIVKAFKRWNKFEMYLMQNS